MDDNLPEGQEGVEMNLQVPILALFSNCLIYFLERGVSHWSAKKLPIQENSVACQDCERQNDCGDDAAKN